MQTGTRHGKICQRIIKKKPFMQIEFLAEIQEKAAVFASTHRHLQFLSRTIALLLWKQ